MADTTLSPPITFAGLVAAGLTLSQAHDLVAMLKRFVDLTNPMDMVSMIIIGANGSQTMRTSNVDSFASYRPAALAGETSQPSLINRVVGYTDISTGDYGNSVAQTFNQIIYSLPHIRGGLDILQILQEAPGAAYNLMRYLMAQLYTSITLTVGAVGTTLSVDDMFSLQTTFNSYVPAQPRGTPVFHAHSRQLAQLRASCRVEPGMVQNSQGLQLQGVDSSRILPNFGGFGFDIMTGDDVVASGGGRYGGAYDRGGVGIATAATNLVPPPGDASIFVASAEMGLLIQQDMTARRQSMQRIDVHFKMGASLGDDNVFRQVAVISIDA